MEAGPVVIGSDRHVTGAYVCEGVEFDRDRMRLTGEASTAGDHAVSLYVLLPGELRPKSWEGCEAELVAPRVLRVRVRADDDRRVGFAVQFG